MNESIRPGIGMQQAMIKVAKILSELIYKSELSLYHELLQPWLKLGADPRSQSFVNRDTTLHSPEGRSVGL